MNDNFSSTFSFVLNNGIEIFPTRMKRQSTGQSLFRVSRGGTGGNLLENCEEVDEQAMVQKVLELGYAVRCASENRRTNGLYKMEGRSVREIKIAPNRESVTRCFAAECSTAQCPIELRSSVPPPEFADGVE